MEKPNWGTVLAVSMIRSSGTLQKGKGSISGTLCCRSCCIQSLKKAELTLLRLLRTRLWWKIVRNWSEKLEGFTGTFAVGPKPRGRMKSIWSFWFLQGRQVKKPRGIKHIYQVKLELITIKRQYNLFFFSVLCFLNLAFGTFSDPCWIPESLHWSTEEKTYAGGGSTLKASYGAKPTYGHTGEVEICGESNLDLLGPAVLTARKNKGGGSYGKARGWDKKTVGNSANAVPSLC